MLVGLGIFAELTMPEALDFLDSKIKLLQGQIDGFSEPLARCRKDIIDATEVGLMEHWDFFVGDAAVVIVLSFVFCFYFFLLSSGLWALLLESKNESIGNFNLFITF